MRPKQIAIKYAEDVINGEIVAGRLIKLACQRFLRDLEREDLIFKEKKIENLVKLGSILHHYTGSHNGKPFILEPWQIFIASNIFGFYWKDSGKRRFIQSYTQIARKNGKTMMTSLFALFALIGDNEPAAEVICAAAQSRDQAGIAFGMIQALCRQLDGKQNILKVLRNEIKMESTNSVLKVVSSDSNSQDGKNISFSILDEVGSAPTNELHDVIISSMGQRSNPHLAMITTAYFDKEVPAYTFRQYCIDILNQTKEDDSIFCAIYEIDEDDDWTDEKVWKKANPNLGITVQVDYLRGQIKTALNNPTDEVGVLTKNLNKWCDSEVTWIPSYKIYDQTKEINLDDFNADEYSCYCGVDLSAISDLTALTFLIIKNDESEYYIKNFYFLPEASLNDKFNHHLYRKWRDSGDLIITNGNVTDYNHITNFLMQYRDKLQFRKISYDSWNAMNWAVQCTELGLPLEPYAQNLGSFNAPTRELERLILSGRLFIDKNPINRYCFANVQLRQDWNGNIKPDKNTTGNKKIDGVISMIQALGVYLKEPHYSGEIITF